MGAKLTNRQKWCLNYLEKISNDFISPTQVGKAYGEEVLKRNNCHSSTGSPILKSLVTLDLVERNAKGWYKLK